MRRNNPSGTFKAHLFADDETDAAASGDPRRATTDEKVASLCSRVSSYGPFRDVEYGDPDEAEADDEMCSVCASAWRKRRRNASQPRDPEGSTPEDGGADGD